MNFFHILISGIVATLVMTFFLYIISWSIGKSVKVVKVLGTMLTFQTRTDGQLSDKPSAIWAGIIAHYSIGIIFSLGFYWLWCIGIGQPTIGYGALFGLIAGCIGITVWRFFFWIHPQPPQKISLPFYFTALVIAHVFFGMTVALTHQWLNH